MEPNRPFFRLDFNEKINITLTNKEKVVIKGELKDVSASGIGFYAGVPLKEKEYNLLFQLEDRTFNFDVVIVREIANTENKIFYGCRFKEEHPVKIGELCMVLLRIDTKRRSEAFEKKRREK